MFVLAPFIGRNVSLVILPMQVIVVVVFLNSSSVPECEISMTTASMLESSPLADSSSVAIADSSFVENRLKKRKKRDSSSFLKLVFETTGGKAPKKNKRSYSSCTNKPCVAVIQNQLDRWVQHSKDCKGKQALPTKKGQTMVIACDILTIAYTLYINVKCHLQQHQP